MKLAVIGGGSSYTPELIKGLIEVNEDLELDEVWLFDIEEGREKLEIVFDFVKRIAGNSFRLFKTFDISEALTNSDYVVFQFRPGFLKARERDESIPLKFDLIGQETTGVGGFSAALRAFPVIEEYVNAVDRYSRATIVNFTNPSGHITEFVLNYLKFDRFIGLCNIPINLLKYVADLMSVEIDDVFFKYYGLNHLTFLERIYVKGRDVTEEVLNKVTYKPENIPQDMPSWLVETLAMIPNPYMRYYLMKDSMLEKLKNSELRSRQVMRIERELMEIYEKADEIPSELSKRGGSMYSTAAAYLMRDLKKGNGKVHIVNTRNSGAVENLPQDYVLEIPTTTRGGRVFPISIGKGNEFALAYIHTIKMYERLTIEAYMERSRRKAIEALLIHPLGPGAERVRELLDELIEANGFDL